MQNTFLEKLRTFTVAHKIISSIVALIILYGGYKIYTTTHSTAGVTKYVLSTATSGSIETSVAESGQVSPSNEINITPQASGNIVSVNVTQGQTVAQGQLIAEIDPTTAEKSVRDAQANLQSAQLSYAKTNEPATALQLTQDQDAVTEASSTLQQDYTTAFTSVSNTFIDLPTIMNGLNQILYGYDISKSEDNASSYNDMIYTYDSAVTGFENSALNDYQTANSLYTTNFIDYRNLSATASTSAIVSLTQETYTTSESISAALKGANDYLNYVKNDLTAEYRPIPTTLTTEQNSLNTYISEMGTQTSSLLSATQNVTNDKNSLTEKSETLAQLLQGPDPLTIQSSQLQVTQAQNALQDAKDTLANYYVDAPLAGTLAKLDVSLGANVGSGTTIATVITTQQIAQLSLNEVDVAKIALGDKATLTFDAIPNLTIIGTVSEIDTIGTVSQGVVTYAVQVTFTTNDPRVKPGMSANANIITNVVENTLAVPNGAVHTDSSGNSYVLVPADTVSTSQVSSSATGIQLATPPVQKVITIGISNTTSTQILSGLNPGDVVITRTIAPTTGVSAATTSAAPSLLGGSTGGRAGGFGGGGVRIGG